MYEYGSGLIIIVLKVVVVQFREVKKLAQGHIKSIGNLVEGFGFGIPAPAMNDVVDGGLFKAAQCGKSVQRDPMLLAQTPYSIGIDFRIQHW